ncbi:hypothetical protein Daura_29215 [Dactylosporangium aurantiacum]|uniref:DUF6545 domain-containing protein n=1 Tax=Dactylosporangium aurantiacum TaxID=35754 RepID=A0A9Q9I833_9ACTN|nr:MAB_1171c family putative transporter [Dactylosporangium aurantiacum]MDG6106734.1 hypothetical protein [Dactylosporangium aurantiacum]UWZ50881.1 hypothetical protein Daura_29215 [Dactylosporangium aurantiacum]
MNGLIYPVAAAVAWIALAYRLVRGLRQDPRDPALYVVCTAFALMGVIFTVSTPAVWARLDAAADIPNLALLISQSGVIAFSGTIQCLIIFWTNPPADGWRQARWRVLWVIAVLAAMAVLFTRAERYGERPTDAAATYAHDPAYAVYLGCYVAMVALGVVDIIRLCLPYARDAGRSWLSRGLRLTAVGAGFGILYCAIRAVTLVEGQLDTDARPLEGLVPPVAALGAMLIVVGLTLPSLGPRLSRVGSWQAQRSAYRRLHPLWTAVAVTVPEVVLDPAHEPPRRIVRDVDRRLRRRVVEIGDGIRQLRHHLADAPDRDAVAYAASLVAACEAHQASLDGTLDEARRARWNAWRATPPATGHRSAPFDGGHIDFADEVRWLVAVSRALHSTTRNPDRTPGLAR